MMFILGVIISAIFGFVVVILSFIIAISNSSSSKKRARAMKSLAYSIEKATRSSRR